MTRKVALFASFFLLTACATHSNLGPPPTPVEQPKPKAADPRVCADVAKEPAMPAGASIPQPVGPEEQKATDAFLAWVQSVLDWGRVNQGRAQTAKDTACPPVTAPAS